jgi:hypothetical protein
MSTAAPASLERDALEVARSAHLLGQTPSAETQKAIEAAARRLKVREARKLARQTKHLHRNAATADVEMADADAEQAEPSLVNAVAAALATPPETIEREKIKVKSRARKSALVPAGAGGMSMDMA